MRSLSELSPRDSLRKAARRQTEELEWEYLNSALRLHFLTAKTRLFSLV